MIEVKLTKSEIRFLIEWGITIDEDSGLTKKEFNLLEKLKIKDGWGDGWGESG